MRWLRRSTTPDPVLTELQAIKSQQNTMSLKEDAIMSALDDLNAATDALSTEITTFLADIAGQISGGVSASDAEAIVTKINGFTSQLAAADPTPPAPPAQP